MTLELTWKAPSCDRRPSERSGGRRLSWFMNHRQPTLCEKRSVPWLEAPTFSGLPWAVRRLTAATALLGAVPSGVLCLGDGGILTQDPLPTLRGVGECFGRKPHYKLQILVQPAAGVCSPRGGEGFISTHQRSLARGRAGAAVGLPRGFGRPCLECCCIWLPDLVFPSGGEERPHLPGTALPGKEGGDGMTCFACSGL